ncbi:hypothetical protein HYQ46_004530 [Verticillium longisporum]|nr:hypothetical protein HYQ46_004530 [Verticillium longisporum]
MRTTRAPDSEAKSSSWNCWLTSQGMRSPDGRWPLLSELRTLCLLILPSRDTWMTHRGSGRRWFSSETGGTRT